VVQKKKKNVEKKKKKTEKVNIDGFEYYKTIAFTEQYFINFFKIYLLKSLFDAIISSKPIDFEKKFSETELKKKVNDLTNCNYPEHFELNKRDIDSDIRRRITAKEEKENKTDSATLEFLKYFDPQFFSSMKTEKKVGGSKSETLNFSKELKALFKLDSLNDEEDKQIAKMNLLKLVNLLFSDKQKNSDWRRGQPPHTTIIAQSKYLPNHWGVIKTGLDKLAELSLDADLNQDMINPANLTDAQIQKKERVLDVLLKLTIDHVYKAYSDAKVERDTQYSYFVDQYIRNILGFQNKSTNSILQNLINLKSDRDAEMFFNFIDRAYHYYYEADESVQPFRESENDTYLLYTGVNTKYESGGITLIYEIHVLCDLYSGAQGKLYGSQNCALKSQELGKNLELVLTKNVNTLEKNRQKWDLNYRRILYTENDTEGNQAAATTTNKTNPENNQGVGKAPEKNTSDNTEKKTREAGDIVVSSVIFTEALDKIEEDREKEFREKIKKIKESNPKITQPELEKFLQDEFNKKYRLSSGKPQDSDKERDYSKLWYPNEALSYIDNINALFRSHNELKTSPNQPDFNKSNLLPYLEKSKLPNERELYDAYLFWNKGKRQYNLNVITELNKLIAIFKSEIENNRRQQEELLRIQKAANSLEFLKLSLDCAKCFLFIKIAKKLIELEDRKPKLNTRSEQFTPAANRGGKKKSRRIKLTKRRVSKKRFTRKNYHSKILG